MNIREDILPLAQAIYSTLSKSELRETARDTKFVQRKGKLKPEDFLVLCSFLEDTVSDESLQELCGTLFYQSKTSLSKQALDSRFNKKATAFLKEIFFQLLGKQNWFAAPIDVNRIFSRIRIMDATSFRLPNEYPTYPGAQGSGVKVQLEYEWYQGKFLHTSVHQETASDRKAALDVEESLQPGDLCLRDLGYYSAKNLKKIQKRGASYISRIPTNTKLWFEDQHMGWLQIHPTEDAEQLLPGETIDYGFVRVGSDPRRSLDSRVVVQKLTKAQRHRREALLQKRKQNGKHSHSASKRSTIQILVTNVTQESLESQELYPLYSLRWQVELLFKTWKSLFKIDKVREMKQERFECHLYGTLIRILLSSMMAFQCRYFLYQKHALEGSEYKGIQQAKRALSIMAHAIKTGIESIIDVIQTVYENVYRHGRKEHKNKHLSPFDILNLSYKATFTG